MKPLASIPATPASACNFRITANSVRAVGFAHQATDGPRFLTGENTVERILAGGLIECFELTDPTFYL